MVRARYLVVGLVLVVLFVAAGGIDVVVSQYTDATDERATNSSVSRDDTDSMMGSEGGDGMGSMTSSGSMMGSFDEEEKPFDLQFNDKMIPHHQGALMSSEHMISNSTSPEMRRLYENIQKSQSEQIEQMQEWRNEWYPDTGQPSGMTGEKQLGGKMNNGMMGGSMQGMMGGNALDTMFLKMIPHHQTAVDMANEALSEAEHPELRDLAQEIRDEQSAEIKLMQGYLET